MSTDLVDRILALARTHVHGSESERREARPHLSHEIALARGKEEVCSEIFRRWIHGEDVNEALRTQMRELEEEVEILRGGSLERPVGRGGDPPTPTTTPTMPTTTKPTQWTAIGVIALCDKLGHKWDPGLDDELATVVDVLDATEAETLVTLCTGSANPTSLYLLGWCYWDGIGTPRRDLDKAVGLFRQSANLGNSSAMTHLGDCLDAGQGVPMNTEEAVSWYRRSADLGNGRAMNRFGLHLEECGRQEEAFHWYQKSAHTGLSVGMYHLGMCYRDGIGTVRDDAKALAWFTKAGDAGDPFGRAEVTDYEDGVRVSRDPEMRIKNMWRVYFSVPVGQRESRLVPHFRERIRNRQVLLSRDRWITVMERLVREEDETLTLGTHVMDLHNEVETLRTELEYRPGGPGYMEAFHDFELRCPKN